MAKRRRPNHRTSLVDDPPDGRIPPFTPAGEARRKAAQGAYFIAEEGHWQGTVHADVAQDLGVGDDSRCAAWRPADHPRGYNSGLMIVESPESVGIQTEYGSEVRVVSMEGRYPPQRSASGMATDGDLGTRTIVAETTNFRPERMSTATPMRTP